MNVLKRKLPLGALALLLVLALAAMGLVYGNWSQTLTIGGTVSTGSVSAEFTDEGGCFDREAKDVGDVGFTVVSEKTINFTVTNGYPNYEADCELHYLYTGQTPGVLDDVSIVPKNLTGCVDPIVGSGGSIRVTCNELQITWNDGTCSAQKQEEILSNSGSLVVKVQKGALESDDPNYPPGGYTFNLEFQYVQWDKTSCA